MDEPLFTGLRELDELTGGFRPGELILLGARPGMGKSSFALKLVEKAGLQEHRSCLFLSLERQESLLVRDLYSLHSGFFHGHERRGTEIEAFRKEHIENGPVLIDDNPVFDLDELISRLTNYSELKLIVIDYLQLLARPIDMQYCLTILKTVAMKLSIPIIVLSQIDRNPDTRADKRPLLSDLRWINTKHMYIVDQILFLYRDDYYNRDTEQYNVMEFILAKHPAGRSGTAKALYRYTAQRFLFFSNENVTEQPSCSSSMGIRLDVGTTKRKSRISICYHCEEYSVPHFILVYGPRRETSLYFEKPMLLDSTSNLDLTVRMDLQEFLTPENWERMILLWNKNNERQVSLNTHIPYYINLQQYQDTAIATTSEEKENLGAVLYCVEDQDQRPHFHYERPDGTVVCISLTEAKYFPPVQNPLSAQEIDRLATYLPLPDKHGVKLYRRLLITWNMQNRNQLDEELIMPDYKELAM